MGTEKDKLRSINRNKPPPIPPRPQYLIPAKTIAKYSSMPDILNGWKRDPNPDLLKLNDSKLSTKIDPSDSTPRELRRVENGAGDATDDRVKNSLKKDVVKKLTSSSYAAAAGDNCVPLNGKATTKCAPASVPEKNGAGKAYSVRKFSCIPSRSNSKKKKGILPANTAPAVDDGNYCRGNGRGGGKRNDRSEISRTSWYVEDAVGDTMVELSKCEITLNCDNNNCRYALEEAPAAAAFGSPATPSTNSAYELHRRKRRPTMASSSLLSGLPPLPKSLSDASLLWSASDKKLSSYHVNLSPSSSSASSSSRTSNSHPKKSLPSSPRSSVSQDLQKSSATHLSGDNVRRDEKRPTPPPPPARKPTSLDMKLATLRREMYDLRQMDLALLSQLYSLNEAIIEFRQMQVSLSPNSLSLQSSDEEDSGCYYSNVSSQGMVTTNQQSNTLGSSSSRSSISTTRSTLKDNIKL